MKLPMVKPLTKMQNQYLSNCPIHLDLKTAISNHFVPLSTMFYWEENMYKQIEIPYLLTVLLAMPLNNISCFKIDFFRD